MTSLKRKYTFFHAYLLSFFHPDLYRDVAKRWRGSGFFYLFVLLVIITIPLTYQLQRGLERAIDQHFAGMVEQLPNIAISDGLVSVDKQTPYVIHDPKTGEDMIIIDTSGTVTNLDNSTAVVLLTHNRIFLRNSKKNKIRSYPLDKIHLEFGRPQAEMVLGVLKQWGVAIFYPLLVILFFIYRLLQALLYSIVALIFNDMLAANLHYGQLLRLTTVAMTPAIIVATVSRYFGYSDSQKMWWYFALSMLFLLFAIASARQSETIKSEQ